MFLLPREHGAWGLLLLPFVCGAVLARQAEWLLLPALIMALAGFVMREPLVVLARQRWVWRERKDDSAAARSCLAWEIPLTALMWLTLAWHRPLPLLAALTGIAFGVTGIAVWMTVKNRQRSIALQMLSAAGLSTTSLLAALAAAGEVPRWAYWLWALLTVHAAGSILVVRARLESKAGTGAALWKGACAFHLALGAAAAAIVLAGGTGAGSAAGFAAAAGLWELARLRRAGALAEPLKSVGWRTLGFSLAQGSLAVAGLWDGSRLFT